MKRISMVLLTLSLACIATTAQAQTVVLNPTAIAFESPSHDADELTRPTLYIVDFYAAGATAPLSSPNIARDQVAVVTGSSPVQYRINFSQLPAYPIGQPLTVRVRASNISGSSTASNATAPFGKPTVPTAPRSATLLP